MQDGMSYSKATWLVLAMSALIIVGAGCAGSVSKDAMVETGNGEMLMDEDDDAVSEFGDDVIDDRMTDDGSFGSDTAVDDGTAVGADVVREIPLIARSWEFVPSRVEVNLGETVRLVITNQDVDHGLMIPTLGVNQKIPAGETVSVEFTADTPGEHSFFCNVFCGAGHRDMRGVLIVE